jgi:predicted dehydrogenase
MLSYHTKQQEREEPTMKVPLKVGVIGLGFMGRAHLSHYLRMPEVQVVALADADPARRAGRAEIVGNIEVPLTPIDTSPFQLYADGRELIEQADVDLVDICLPTHLHAELAVFAAERGKHVVVEKPMALNSAEADRMVAAAKAAGVRLMVAQCLRFWPEYEHLRETVRSASLGRLLQAEFSRRSARPIWTWQGWMIQAEKSGGAILDLHIHDVDFVNHVLGKPSRIYASAVKTPATGGYDLVNALYSYEGGPEVRISAAWYLPRSVPFRAAYTAVFERGVLSYDSSRAPTLLLHSGEGEGTAVHVEGDAYYKELRYFVDCLLTGKDPAELVSPESARDSLFLVESEIRSALSGEPIRLQ